MRPTSFPASPTRVRTAATACSSWAATSARARQASAATTVKTVTIICHTPRMRAARGSYICMCQAGSTGNNGENGNYTLSLSLHACSSWAATSARARQASPATTVKTVITLCHSPCMRAARGSYICTCQAGFTGNNCENGNYTLS